MWCEGRSSLYTTLNTCVQWTLFTLILTYVVLYINVNIVHIDSDIHGVHIDADIHGVHIDPDIRGVNSVQWTLVHIDSDIHGVVWWAAAGEGFWSGQEIVALLLLHCSKCLWYVFATFLIILLHLYLLQSGKEFVGLLLLHCSKCSWYTFTIFW